MYRWMKKALPLPLIMAMLVFSFGTAGTAFANGTERTQKYSGEDIFKGMVFGVGELGGKLPVDSKITNEIDNDTKTLEVIEEILNEIKKLEPNYFNELQDAAYSKNPVKVDQMIDHGGILFEKALDNLGYLASAKQDPDVAAAVAGWLVMVGAAAYNYAGVVHTALAGVNAAAYLNLAVYQYVYLWGDSASSTKLEREAYILEVMEALDK